MLATVKQPQIHKFILPIKEIKTLHKISLKPSVPLAEATNVAPKHTQLLFCVALHPLFLGSLIINFTFVNTVLHFRSIVGTLSAMIPKEMHLCKPITTIGCI